MSSIKQVEFIKTDLGLEVKELFPPYNQYFIGHSTDVYDVLEFLYDNFNFIFTEWLRTGGKEKPNAQIIDIDKEIERLAYKMKQTLRAYKLLIDEDAKKRVKNE